MINGNEILDLMYKPMYNDDVLNMMEKLGMKIPELDEKYQLEEIVDSATDDGTIDFEFSELNGYSKDGIPSLSKIEIVRSKLSSLPFDISDNDNYDICCKKIGEEGHKVRRATARRWEITLNNLKLLVVINFSSEQLEEISFLQVFENIEE
ncbi:hypothetical protein MNB_SM-4-1163 [hydrothermal vent metagenome]|uniref:Uncharacterized protein n=1 Tax=hydrothermal vent metagenome TaxID=652676 RepID=A0A1W1CFG5_9ZZZZ